MNPEPADSGTGEQDSPLITLDSVTKSFVRNDSLLDRLLGTRTSLTAVSDVSLTVYEGETLGIVGESGSGKSTLGHLVSGLEVPTEGEILIDGDRVGGALSRPKTQLADVGVVFQNTTSSIDPRLTTSQVIGEPLRAAGWSQSERDERINELLRLVNLSARHTDRYVHELSGGQIQRVAVARAIATEPRVVILDEAVSAVDVSIQGTILNLLMRLQEDLGLTYIFISHDLSVLKHIADRIAVMYLGEVMEVASAAQLFESPAHVYTDSLLKAIPDVDPSTSIRDTVVLAGDIPSPVDPPRGCVFHPRCPIAEPQCRTDVPEMMPVGESVSKCHFASDVYHDRK